MYSDLERSLIRELDSVADDLVVPPLPRLPVTSPGRQRWQAVAPLVAAAAVAVVILAMVIGRPQGREPEPAPEPAPSPTKTVDTGPVSTAAPASPVAMSGRLLVGGVEVPGRWSSVEGSGTHWVAQRAADSGPNFVGPDGAGSWWWGYDARPQQLEGTMYQAPVISPRAGYLARVLSEGGGAMLVGADTEEGGEGFGGVDLPGAALDPAVRAVAVTDAGLVVVAGTNFQRLWRPLIDDGETIDLAQTEPGQVVIGNTGAGLLVNEGDYNSTDGTQGAPYLAQLSDDGTLTRVGAVPTHDVLEASGQWLSYVPPGTVGGEASGTTALYVQRIDGSQADALLPPEGWLFVAPGFSWETDDRLLALVVTRDGGDEALVRCRPAPSSCVFVDLP